MSNLKSGLSGCKIELLNGNTLRKHSSSKDYNDRLKIQVKKQSLFSHFVLNNIDTPNILKVNENSIFSFDMEYVCGYSFDEYFTHISIKEVDNIVDSLFGYFDFLIDNSKIYNQQLSKSILLKKINSIDNYRKDFLNYLTNKISDIEFKIPYSFCHGDLTFSNIIFHPRRLYFIDFLDSFIDSYLIDFSKLKQDLYYGWNLKIQDINNLRIKQVYNYIWYKIENRYESHINRIEFKIVDVINFLRIEPYLTCNRNRVILDKILETTDIYEEFNRSHGWKV